MYLRKAIREQGRKRVEETRERMSFDGEEKTLLLLGR